MAPVREHLADPLFRNAYALMINTGVTGLLGLGYWLLAARRYTAADVGRASAAYSAMNLLAGFTALNLTGALTRFIPQSGRHTAAFVVRAYVVSSAASAVIAVPFLLTVSHWGASYTELAGVTAGLIFTACVVTWAIFTLQDGVLTGLRSAIWVPMENGLFGIVKIVLLVALAAVLPHAGIYVSWMLPVAVSLPLINTLIFGRLVPRHASLSGDRPPPTTRQIGRFLAGDYTGALCALATTTLVPVTVAARIDPKMNAYFYMAWVIGGTLELFAVNMATSLTVEGAFDPAALAANCRSALRRTVVILVPIAAGLALVAPRALGLFGAGYAAHGALILQLLAAAALPSTVTELYIGSLRAQSRTSMIAIVQGVRSVLVLGLALALTLRMGIVGAGVAVLASQVAVAAMVAPGLRRVIAGRPAAAWSWRQAVARIGGRLAVTGPCALAAAGAGLFLVPLRGVDLGRMNGLGLISVLPVACLAGIGLLAVAFVLMLSLSRPRPAELADMLACAVICLDGATLFAERQPRFPTAYQIAGYVEYISRTGHVAPGLAAYFSWPAFFALVAFVQAATGGHSLIPVLGVWPVIVDLLSLAPLFLIMRNLRLSWRAKWLAAFLFTLGNWVGQDYFSPQSFNYLLYLVFVAILLTWFRPAQVAGPPPTRMAARLADPGWRGVFTRGESPPVPAGPAQRVILLGLLIAIFVLSTASHQLTPFFMLAACAGLVVARRCTLTGLPVLLGVIVTGWISFAAVAFWSGHLSTLFGGIGHLGANVSTSVAGRMAGSTPLHLRTLEVRTGLASVVMILALCGLARRRREAVSDRSLYVLTCVPFLAAGLQSYGGEIALRVYLFALPAACILAACAFFPAAPAGGTGSPAAPGGGSGASPRAGAAAAGRPWAAVAAAGACAVLFSGAFFVARYGNEAYERVPRGEIAAADYVYAHDASGARLIWLSADPAVDNTPQMPWQYRDIEKVDYIAAQAPRDPADVTGLVSSLRALGPGSYLVTTRTQESYLEQTASYPPGWGGRFRADMSATPSVRVAFADRDAVVFAARLPPGTPRRPLHLDNGAPVRPTLWTPLGLAVLGILLFVLTLREFARVRLAAPRRILRPLTLMSLPLLVFFAVIVAERFAVLS